MLNLRIENYFKLVLSISLISIISAYYIEFVLGHKPCNLCLIERIPYGLSIFLVALNFFLKKNTKFFILLLTLIFIFSFIISV